jgi:hypothetical protein
MTRTCPFFRDPREPATVNAALAKSIAETQADIRAAFRRRLAKDCMSQVNEQPRVGYDLTPTCPTCGCLDVIIQGHEMSCKRCGTTTDRSKEKERATR